LIVADYRHMLMLELSGQRYSKTEHRRALLPRLNNRSEGSIERKHQNISAALIALGCPCIRGYKPLSNYQTILFDAVEALVLRDRLFDEVALSAVEQPAVVPLTPDFSKFLADPPSPYTVREPGPGAYVPRATVRDYLERETRNRSLGAAGEDLALASERPRLWRAGKSAFSDRVEQVSKTQGDGLGYDILSYDVSGAERFIEVKTTAFAKDTPFYISRREVVVSAREADRYHVYRIFDFRRRPQMYAVSGAVQNRFVLHPTTFLAHMA